MEIGLMLPQTGPNATRAHIATMARTAEECGYAALWVSDHVVYPRKYRSLHPDRPGGVLPAHFDPQTNLIEPVTLLTFVAGITERIQLGTSVLVLPMRQPVLYAKILASLDHLAGGRFILGAGAGWAREEFEVLSASFERRGARIEEQVAVMRALWSGEWVEHHGEFYEVDGWISRPAPPRMIPVWSGGARPVALRRAGRIGDGWLAGIYRLPTLSEDIATVRRAAAEAGRDPDALHFHLGGVPRLVPGHEEQQARQLREIAAKGAHGATFGISAPAEQAPEVAANFARKYLDDLRDL